MSLDSIEIHYNEISFTYPNPTALKSWILDTVTHLNQELETLSIVLCNDQYVLNLNKKYLSHDYYTDILTFPHSDESIDGELYISIDRVGENARTECVQKIDELDRVIIHGILHLAGFDDKTIEMQEKMRALEDFYLARRAESS
jgi:metalloprotein, YbeY/UPF0054 family